MPNRERISTKALAVLLAATVTGTGKTGYVDASEVDALSFIIAGGTTGADGSNTLTISLEHADEAPTSAASYSAVPDTQVRGAAVIEDDDQAAQIAYVGNKRYVRVVYTEDGVINGTVSITAVGERLARGDHPEGVTLTTGAVA